MIWLLTGGLFLVGWIVDLFLIPSMDRAADQQYTKGQYDYDISWILQTFFGYLGIHRFYLRKWGTGLLWFSQEASLASDGLMIFVP